jgi:tetratricopeptide (TPR) repeat protein
MPDKAEQTDDSVPVVTTTEKAASVKKDPPTAIDSHVLFLLLTGETALQRKKYDVALEAYLEAAKRVKDPRVAEKAAQIGMYLDNLPKTEKAISLWVDKDDKNVRARQLALSTAVTQKNQAALLKHLEVILKNDPASFEATLLGLEKNLKIDADRQFVYQALDALAKQHPKQAMIFLTQSLLAVRQNNLELARQKVHQALVLQPAWEKALNFEAELMFYSGKLAFKNKRYTEALAWFDKVKQPPIAFEAALAGVSVLMDQKKFSEAEARLETLLAKEQDPKKRQELTIVQAELQSLQKNYQQAFDILTKALKDEPDNRDILYARALTAEKMDNTQVLEADLQKILAQDPDDFAALNALGYSLTDKTTRYDEAEKYLQRALKLQPDEAMIIDSYGLLKFKKGNLEAALKYLQTAHQKMPENEITAHLAEALWTLGKKQEAESLIREALKKTPTDEFLLEFQKRVLNGQPAIESK